MEFENGRSSFTVPFVHSVKKSVISDDTCMF
jgi:hypothetical protein